MNWSSIWKELLFNRADSLTKAWVWISGNTSWIAVFHLEFSEHPFDVRFLVQMNDLLFPVSHNLNADKTACCPQGHLKLVTKKLHDVIQFRAMIATHQPIINQDDHDDDNTVGVQRIKIWICYTIVWALSDKNMIII